MSLYELRFYAFNVNDETYTCERTWTIKTNDTLEEMEEIVLEMLADIYEQQADAEEKLAKRESFLKELKKDKEAHREASKRRRLRPSSSPTDAATIRFTACFLRNPSFPCTIYTEHNAPESRELLRVFSLSGIVLLPFLSFFIIIQ